MIRDLLRKIINEETSNNQVPKVDIVILKKLHQKKKELKTKENILNYLKEILKFFSISPSKSLLYYQMFIMNYRENGDYENISAEDFIGPKDINPIKITNVNASSLTTSTIPFNASNLKGFWEKDGKGVQQYVVTSYDWYPIYIFKNNQWYGNTDSYSSSTIKHLYNSRPDSDYTTLNRKEMERLRMGDTIENIIETRPLIFLQKRKDDLLMKNQSMVINTVTDGDVRVFYKIINMSLIDDKINIHIQISSLKKLSTNEKINEVSEELNGEILSGFYNQILNKFGKSYELNINQISIDIQY